MATNLGKLVANAAKKSSSQANTLRDIVLAAAANGTTPPSAPVKVQHWAQPPVSQSRPLPPRLMTALASSAPLSPRSGGGDFVGQIQRSAPAPIAPAQPTFAQQLIQRIINETGVRPLMAGGGGALPPGVQGPPGPPGSWVNPYGPQPAPLPIAGMPLQGPRPPIGPLQGPPAPNEIQYWETPKRSEPQLSGTYYPKYPGEQIPFPGYRTDDNVYGIPPAQMPSVSDPGLGVRMPTQRGGETVTFEDGSTGYLPPDWHVPGWEEDYPPQPGITNPRYVPRPPKSMSGYPQEFIEYLYSLLFGDHTRPQSL